MTVLQIWNMALGFLGITPLGSETDNSPAAEQCRLYWDSARRCALRDYPWNFAIRQSMLSPATLPAIYAKTWGYAYTLPAGCLHLLSVTDGSLRRRVEYVTVVENNSRLILCRIPDAAAEYVADTESPEVWDESFCFCMARKLACLLAAPLLKDTGSRQQVLETLYRSALPEAKRNDASENPKHGTEIDSWLARRWR